VAVVGQNPIDDRKVHGEPAMACAQKREMFRWQIETVPPCSYRLEGLDRRSIEHRLVD
jgi:hypothetical protein